jgi:hypothetical protein
VIADRIEVDYLVVGAGAGGMAFADSLVADSDRTVAIVDRRHAPGGHWNDAYPFVRLHQPSAYYGVNSLRLGEDSIDQTGPNAGFYEVANASEICNYFDRAMRAMLATGRVQFLPLSDYEVAPDGSHHVVSRVTGRRLHVTVRRKLVDATYLENSIPATHRRTFEVGEGARCVPINALARIGAPSERYVVVGSGKTAMDACLWLLDQQVSPARIRWVRPREAWVLDRAYAQPLALVGTMLEGAARQVEAAAAASTVTELFERLEAAGQLLRVDERITPTMYRCASVSARELQELRRIEDVVRLGRVRRLDAHGITLEHGTVTGAPDDLYIDCTAIAFGRIVPRPMFEADRITLQPVRTCQPCLNSALIGRLEATRDDLEDKNRLCPPNPYPSVPEDWMRMFVASNMAQFTWAQDPDLAGWLGRSRLNVSRGTKERRDEPALRAPLQRIKQSMGPALANLVGLQGV